MLELVHDKPSRQTYLILAQVADQLHHSARALLRFELFLFARGEPQKQPVDVAARVADLGSRMYRLELLKDSSITIYIELYHKVK